MRAVDMVLLALAYAFVVGLVVLSIKTSREEDRRRRQLRAMKLERLGIFASSTFEPYDPNGYRRTTYLQKLEGLCPKGPRGWVKARHG